MEENGTLHHLLTKTRAQEREEPGLLADILQQRLAAPIKTGPRVAERLVRKFGYGQSPVKRKELYRRLEKLAEAKGEAVIDLISEAVAESVGARMPDRYFCRAIVLKLREHGFTLNGSSGGDASW